MQGYQNSLAKRALIAIHGRLLPLMSSIPDV